MKNVKKQSNKKTAKAAVENKKVAVKAIETKKQKVAIEPVAPVGKKRIDIAAIKAAITTVAMPTSGSGSNRKHSIYLDGVFPEYDPQVHGTHTRYSKSVCGGIRGNIRTVLFSFVKKWQEQGNTLTAPQLTEWKDVVANIYRPDAAVWYEGGHTNPMRQAVEQFKVYCATALK
jgi:hypothetical protein